MKCIICGNEISNYGNNPFPLCAEDDYESRCCDSCDAFVIQARIALMKKNEDIKDGDTVVIFYSKQSELPTKVLADTGKFLSGEVYSVYERKNKINYVGSWGSFELNNKTDQFVKL